MIPDTIEARVLLLSRRLRECGIPHAFGRAIAYACYGLPRSTNAFDINVFLPESGAAPVFECLRPLGVQSSPESVTTVMASGQVRLDWDDQKVVFFFAYAPFHLSVAQRVREEPVRDETITVLSGEDIVVFKVIFNRPLDWRDIDRLFQQGTTRIDLQYVTRWLREILGDGDSRIQRLKDGATAVG